MTDNRYDASPWYPDAPAPKCVVTPDNTTLISFGGHHRFELRNLGPGNIWVTWNGADAPTVGQSTALHIPAGGVERLVADRLPDLGQLPPGRPGQPVRVTADATTTITALWY